MRVLKFSATWCGPCQQIGPDVKRLCAERALPLEEIDSDECPNMCEEYAVRALPTIVAEYADGRREKVEGADLQSIAALLARLAASRPAASRPEGA